MWMILMRRNSCNLKAKLINILVKMKTIILAGASGMIGSCLFKYLDADKVIKVERKDFHMGDKEFAEKFREADIILNMSGSSIIRRWTPGNRKDILNSRIQTTQKLSSIITRFPERKRLYLTASAIGIYDDRNIHTENSENWSKGFIKDVVRLWEEEALSLASEKTKVTILRFGVVLSEEGGILARMLPVFRAGLGGRIGNGYQYLSWIHILDLARAVDFIINRNSGGIYNITSPGYCRNRDFTTTLARAVKRPALFALPSLGFRLIYGKGAAIITGGQAVIPERLMKEGFRFNYPDLESALATIVN
jgi:uncharacterized protein (TIGR01777 family)